MSIVTISRGSFSSGEALAQCLAGKLGYRCVDRDVIVERAAARGVSQDELRDALARPPTFLERFQHKKYVYLALIQAALAEEVRTGKAVYHGHAGHLLLKAGRYLLRVRIIAPLELRVRKAQERLKFSRGEALAYIEKVDQDRRKWTHYLYGVDWGDPALYDAVLNLENMEIAEACESLAILVRRRCFELSPEDQAAMNDFALASRVRADLALNPSTSHLEFQVTAIGGAVKVGGKATAMREFDEIRRVVGLTAGVTALDVEEVVPPGHV